MSSPYWILNPLDDKTVLALNNVRRGYAAQVALFEIAYLMAVGCVKRIGKTMPAKFEITWKGADALEFYGKEFCLAK